MKKTLIAAIALASASGLFAKTTIYGEADAKLLINNSDAGSFMSVDGWGSEFGFKGTQPINEQESAYFIMAFNPNLLFSATPALTEGAIGLEGSYGKVELFFNESPLGALNNQYFIMDNSPDDIFSILGSGPANVGAINVSVGDAKMDGLRYVSNTLEGGISFDLALIPEEALNGQTGFSVAGHYDSEAVRVSAAFEVNSEFNDTQIFRVNGDVKAGNATVGGTFQSGTNSALDTKSSHVAGYVKIPFVMSGQQVNARLLVAFNTVTDAADTKTSEMYTSFVEEIPFNEKVSAYGFFAISLENDLQDTFTQGGGGLKVRF